MTAKEFLLDLPNQMHPSALEGLQTRFHFDLEGDGGGQYTVSLENGVAITEEGLHGEPKCVVKSTADNFVKLVKGELNPMMAIMMGKVKITNPGEMTKFAKLLGLM